MTTLSQLTIGGIELPIETHLELRMEIGRHSSGRKSLSISAVGWYPPALDAIDWSAPVSITWADLATDGATSTLSVLSIGPQRTDDLRAVSSAWTLKGVESSGLSALVSIGGTAYWASVAREPIGGVIQRKTNGAGTLLHAWSKHKVTITGEGGSAPAVPGVVAIVSTLYTGDLLTMGVGARMDPATGLIVWTISGEQP